MDPENDSQKTLDSLLEFGRTLLKWSWLLIIVGAIAFAGFYYYTNLQTRVYQATTRLVVNVTSEASGMDVYSQSFNLAGQYARTMVTRKLLEKTASRLGYPISTAVEVLVDENFPILTIRVTDTDPQRAADTANMIVTVFSEEETGNQASRYAELEANFETEIARIDTELTSINSKLAAFQATDGTGNANLEDTATYVRRSQLEMALTQYTQTRYSLVYNLQQLRLTEIKSQINFIQLDPATKNSTPVEPQPLRSALYAGLIGISLAGLIVWLLNNLRDEITDLDEITRKYHVPIIGIIPEYKYKNNVIISLKYPRSPYSESYRLLRTNLQYAEINKPLKSILVTSSTPSEGKSSVVANLGQVMAQIHQNVVLIDCDLHRPQLHKFFNLTNWAGITDLMIRRKKLSEVTFRTELPNLYQIPSGPLPPNPSELLNSVVLKELVDFLAQKSDVVILDSPPILAVVDPLVLAPKVDGVILVVNPNRTKQKMLEQSIEQLQQINARLLGIVFNEVKFTSLHYGNKRKYYGKKYSAAYQYGEKK